MAAPMAGVAAAPPPRSLPRFLADLPADAVALIDGDATLTVGALDDLSRRAARGLAGLGVGPGDRVALWLPNIPAWPVLQLACARLGAIAVAINTRFRSAEVQDIVGRAGCKLLALAPRFKAIDFAGILADVDPAALTSVTGVIACDPAGAGDPGPLLPGRATVLWDDLVAGPPLDDDRSSPEAGCIIFTTSGTTRAPKLVLHRQSVIVRHATDAARALGYDAPDAVLLQALPFCGVFGFCQAMATLAAARPMVLMPVFDGAEAARLMVRHRVTDLNGTDEMLDRLLAATTADRPFPALRAYGYARFNPALDDLLTGAPARGIALRGLFGMSECQALFASQPPGLAPADQAQGGGHPVSSEAAVRAVDPETGAVLPDGVDGALELKGPSLMVGYYGDPETTAAAFTPDGYFRTGDLGRTLGNGRFVFQARLGDVLRLAGLLVSPAEIEAHLMRHPAVEGAQVVGVTRRAGTRAVAFVVPRAGATAEEAALIAHCKRGLAAFKVPERIVTLTEFPTAKSANGTKIQRARLREMAEAL